MGFETISQGFETISHLQQGCETISQGLKHEPVVKYKYGRKVQFSEGLKDESKAVKV